MEYLKYGLEYSLIPGLKETFLKGTNLTLKMLIFYITVV